ncbi:sensor histidine kinase [Agrococcus sp. TSP3-2-1]|uniref:sensor histidine kinase n=1 Tax=Agrococcus sp. TSP3-2-1 TaxID=2804583 RepID=UPI003CEB0E74
MSALEPGERSDGALSPQTRKLQVPYALLAATVLLVMGIADPGVWSNPWEWTAVGILAIATIIALIATRLPAGSGRARSVVPMLDLVAIAVLLVDASAPPTLALLAVLPAFWIGIVAGRRGIAIVAAVSAVIAAILGVHLAGTTGTLLTANAVGTVLIPASLMAAAWSAHYYSRLLERQQRTLLERERERTEIARKAAADATLIDAVFETARIGLMLLDTEGRIERVNPTMRDHPAIAGGSLTTMLDGARFLEIDTRRRIRHSRTPLVRAARGEAFDNVDCWIDRPGSDPVAVRMSSRPIMLDGEFRGSIASIDDVTNYMRMLEDRDDFVALVSHELRTPLTSIAGYLEIALDEDLPDDLRAWLETAQRNSNRLRALVEDLLVVGEMSRGEVKLQATEVDLRALATDAVALLEPRGRRKRVSLRLVDGPVAMVEGDPRRLSQVIENLISNGIKYTHDDGDVEVRVEIDGQEAVVSVHDDGPGVRPDEVARVFERFYRSSSARASQLPGAGLGLWICRMIVHGHGGSIDFSSELGVGSVASFRLPRRA